MTQTAKIYGDGLYDLAAEEGLVENMMQDLQAVRALMEENPDYIRLLSEPSVPKEERIGLIDAAFSGQVEHYLVNFMKLLCEHSVIGEFYGCCDAFTERYRADHNITEAVVYSAVALSEAQAKTLQEKLEKMSGKTVVLTQKLDPKALAGLRVEIDGKQYDGTVKGRIDGISKKMNEIIV